MGLSDEQIETLIKSDNRLTPRRELLANLPNLLRARADFAPSQAGEAKDTTFIISILLSILNSNLLFAK